MPLKSGFFLTWASSAMMVPFLVLSDIDFHPFAVIAFVHVDDQRFVAGEAGLNHGDDLVHADLAGLIDPVRRRCAGTR